MGPSSKPDLCNLVRVFPREAPRRQRKVPRALTWFASAACVTFVAVAVQVLAPPPEPAFAPVAAVTPGVPVEPSAPPAPPALGAPTAQLGTGITWDRNPVTAFQRASREGKLVFLLQLSGNFDEPEET